VDSGRVKEGFARVSCCSRNGARLAYIATATADISTAAQRVVVRCETRPASPRYRTADPYCNTLRLLLGLLWRETCSLRLATISTNGRPVMLPLLWLAKCTTLLLQSTRREQSFCGKHAHV
jgi:hypothetical protein